MSKMHYFSNKFSKLAKRWGFSPPAHLKHSILVVTWSSVIWPNCVFSSC